MNGTIRKFRQASEIKQQFPRTEKGNRLWTCDLAPFLTALKIDEKREWKKNFISPQY